MITSFGNLSVPCEYDNLGLYFRGEYLEALQNEHWGIINMKGKTVIRFRYEKIRWINDTTIEGYVNGIWEKVEL
ncbi:MAG: WG repeat-containing protein [Saprospiraceae bacterium]|nr:WG repeat-containing protein [Saprospiraceae bacterium]